MRINCLFALLALPFFMGCQSNPPTNHLGEYDLIIYGGTSAGVVAAYSAQKLGKKALIIEPQKHLGGMSASGLGETDIGNKYVVSGVSRDFYRRLGKFYNRFEAWRFEPSKAEAVFNDYIKESGAEVKLNYRIVGLKKEGARIIEIELESCDGSAANFTVSGKMFIDASYEGDLMARAGVTFRIGREDNSEYNETLNGVQFHGGNQIPDGIDPYVVEGDSTSGLLWGVNPLPHAPEGTGDTLVQAYCYRLCLTNTPENRRPFARPDGYDSTRYEVLRRIIKQRDLAGWNQRLKDLYLRVMPMPNGKTDVNNKGGFSLDYIGASYDYAKVDYARRKEIEMEHVHYTKGLLYFLATDPAIPQHLKDQVNEWGWPKDEFTDNANFPWQLYVREARRLVGEYVMTQANCEHTATVTDGIAMGAYNMDSHNCQRVIVEKDGKKMLKNEGDIQHSVKPYAIAYRSIVPKLAECENLLVPVCMSATHIAYGSIRMEPVFMVMGQSAALAAVMAIDNNIPVQQIDVAALQSKLLTDPLFDGTPVDVLADDAENGVEVILSGKGWNTDSASRSMYKTTLSYCMAKEGVGAEFRGNPTADALYKIYYYAGTPSKSVTSPVATALIFQLLNGTEITYGKTNIAGHADEWVELGEYELKKDRPVAVKITAEFTGDSLLVADALLFVPIKQ